MSSWRDPALLEALSRAGVHNPTRDAARLYDWARKTAGAVGGDPSATSVQALFREAMLERSHRKPVSQIIGRRAFWESEFEVTPDVLDPRPETETLVAAALDVPFSRLLDLGTGSGCIAISLLQSRPKSRGFATDLSEAALAVARRNAKRAGLHRLDFVQSDWFDAVDGQFDLIVSNPPYIRADEMPDLAPEVRDHEPRMALTDESDGLSAYRVIAASAPRHLKEGGWLMVEVGVGQADPVSALFEQVGLAQIDIRPDMDNRPRVVIAQRVANW